MALKKHYKAMDHLLIALAALSDPESTAADPAQALSDALGSDDLGDALADLNDSQDEMLDDDDADTEICSRIQALPKSKRLKLLSSFIEKAGLEDDEDLEVPSVDDAEAVADFMTDMDPEAASEAMDEADGGDESSEDPEEESDESEEDEAAEDAAETARLRRAAAKGRRAETAGKRTGPASAGKVRSVVRRVNENLRSL